jgi:hypothetical protein
MNVAATEVLSPVEIVFAYHARTKHTLQRYAAGPEAHRCPAGGIPGIDIDNRNDNGATALMYAASSGKAAVVERLLSNGADATPETLDGFSALDLAQTMECVTLLRPKGRFRAASEPRPTGPPVCPA